MSREPTSSSQRLSQAREGWTLPKVDPPPPPPPPKEKKYRVRVEPAKKTLRDYPTPRLGRPRDQTIRSQVVTEGEEKLLAIMRKVAPGEAGEAAERLRVQHERHKELDRRWQDMTPDERSRF